MDNKTPVSDAGQGKRPPMAAQIGLGAGTILTVIAVFGGGLLPLVVGGIALAWSLQILHRANPSLAAPIGIGYGIVLIVIGLLGAGWPMLPGVAATAWSLRELRRSRQPSATDGQS